MDQQQQTPPQQQDPHKRKISIVLVAVLATVVIVLVIANLLRPSSSTTEAGAAAISDADVEAGMGDVPPEDATPMPPPAALEFKDVLVLMDHSYSIDGGPMVEAVCSDADPASTFATLKVGDKVLELTCLDDYMGGIAIKGASEPPLYEKIALKFGDAGQLSDKRAWVRKTPEGLSISTVTRWSQDDIDEEEAGQSHVECGTESATITISAKDLSWSKSETKANPAEFPFNPPANINAKCL